MALPRLHQLNGHGAALITGLSITPSLVLLLGLGDAESLAEAAPSTGVVAYALVLGAAVLTYFYWRVIAVGAAQDLSRRLAAWLTVGLTASAVHGLVQVAPLEDGPGVGPDRWSVVIQLMVVLMLCAAAAVAERVDLPTDPALVGAAAAAVIIAVSAVTRRSTPPLELGGSVAAVLEVAVALAGLALVWILLHRTQVSLWARRRLALSAALLTAAQCARNVDQQHPALMAGVMAAFLLGSLNLCGLTQRLLRDAVLLQQAELHFLQRSLAEVRAAVVDDRELLHEVGATLAGITTASQVMRQGHAVPAHRRQRLETMLVAELERLERLMLARSSGAERAPDCEIDVDAVVEPLVTSHQARGRDVWWNPSGATAVGDPDELAEVVNILLENAARHGRGGVVRLSVDASDGGVVAICADSGPGVPPELRERLFDREVRGPDSPGQGLGLAIAHRLVSARGGSLELVDVERPGATFVARLPQKEPANGAACHVA